MAFKLAAYCYETLSQICVAQAHSRFWRNSPGSPTLLALTKTGPQVGKGVIPDVLNKLIQLHPTK